MIICFPPEATAQKEQSERYTIVLTPSFGLIFRWLWKKLYTVTEPKIVIVVTSRGYKLAGFLGKRETHKGDLIANKPI